MEIGDNYAALKTKYQNIKYNHKYQRLLQTWIHNLQKNIRILKVIKSRYDCRNIDTW